MVTVRESAGRLILLGLAAGLAVVALWLGTVQTPDGQRIADMILYGRLAADPALLGAATETLGTLRLAFVLLLAAGLALFALGQSGVGLMVAVVVILGGANVTTQGLKLLLERPNLLGDVAYATGNSFPSGHVTLASSLGLVAILVAPRRLRTPLAIVAGVLVAAVGASTIIAGWHRLADAVAAILLSLAWASLVTAILVLAQGWVPRRTWGRGLGGRATTFVGGLGLAAVAVGLTGITIGVLDPTPLEHLIESGVLPPGVFAAALVVAAGTSLVACASYVWAMRGVALERHH